MNRSPGTTAGGIFASASSLLVAMTNIQYSGNAESRIVVASSRYVQTPAAVSCGARPFSRARLRPCDPPSAALGAVSTALIGGLRTDGSSTAC